MGGTINRFGPLIVMSALCLGSTLADEPTTVVQIPCPGGPALWLWAQGVEVSCDTIGNEYVCHDTDNYSRGSCSAGCQEIRVGSLAGCYRGSAPSTWNSNFTKVCHPGSPQQVVYDLTGVPGDECVDVNDASMPDGGAECSQTIGDQKVTSAKVDCRSGCVSSRPPGDCKRR
ncbi:MAG: hypothetical protein KBD01_09640 [Acidobacteria bacterium]|nr:hypothetical protein [Acidobacteriota bacterium]